MAGTDMLGLGVTGLFSAQAALQTTSHNISNANTEGYNRQRVQFGTLPPQFFGGSYFGSGVQVASVERVYNGFLASQVSIYQSSVGHAQTVAQLSSSLDELLADSSVGMMPAIQDFFTATQDVANDPSSLPPRQTLLTQAEILVDRFHSINQRMDELRNQVNSQLADEVSEINALADSIAQINQNIVLSPGPGEPNDLLDQRDRLLGQLAEHIAVTTVPQDDGSANVFVGNGQSLVVGFQASAMEIMPNRFNVTQFEVGVNVGGGSAIEISSQLTGGSLGGLLEFRENILDPAQNQLGVLAMGLGQTFNEQHQLGQDLDGNPGQEMFQLANLLTLPDSGVSNFATANLSDATQLTSADYMLRYDGGNNYTVTRLTDNQTFSIDTGGASPFTTAEIDGFTLTLAAGANVGDQILIQPTRTAAREIQTNISDPNQVAAATPVLGSLGLNNSGSAEITRTAVTDVGNLPLPTDVTLTYNSLANEFTVTGAVPAVAPIPYTSGGTIAFNGLELAISGTPADGDEFVLSNNVDGVSDNRNALLMANLQTQRLLSDGDSTYQDTYNELVTDVGIKTNQATIAEEAQTDLLSQALSQQQSVSGVNLDEEAANLLKFQQAYQASAQVISTADAIFQTLLNAVSR